MGELSHFSLWGFGGELLRVELPPQLLVPAPLPRYQLLHILYLPAQSLNLRAGCRFLFRLSALVSSAAVPLLLAKPVKLPYLLHSLLNAQSLLDHFVQNERLRNRPTQLTAAVLARRRVMVVVGLVLVLGEVGVGEVVMYEFIMNCFGFHLLINQLPSAMTILKIHPLLFVWYLKCGSK